METKDKAVMTVHCVHCNDEHVITVNASDFRMWQGGARIQVVMPYLSKDERDLLISGVCNKCLEEEQQEEMFI